MVFIGYYIPFQALQIWCADHSFSARIQLLVVEIDSAFDNFENPSVLDDVGKVLVLNKESCNAWLVRFSLYYYDMT